MNTPKKILTRDFGEVEVPDEHILSFPNGIYGFGALKNFALLSPLGEDAYPMWLQSVEERRCCFVVFDPMDILADYSPTFTTEELDSIKAEKNDILCYLCIAVVHKEDYTKTTVNLKSPIIINKNKAIAAQIILEDNYKLKYPLFSDKGDEQNVSY